MRSIAEAVGRVPVGICVYLGQLCFLLLEVVQSLFVARLRVGLVIRQIWEIGARSQLVVGVTGAFTGAVFTAQTFFQFSKLGMSSAVGALVAVSMCRELGPVLAGLMLAGRVGASITAEIGTMKVSEQIDALRTLAVHPVDYLVTPRMIAMLIAMPILVGESIALGVGVSYLVGVQVLGIEGAYFIDNMMTFTDGKDVMMGLLKGAVFGQLIVLISCQQGLNTTNGAVGVGQSTTTAVVNASLAILIVNFFLTMLLNMLIPTGRQ